MRVKIHSIALSRSLEEVVSGRVVVFVVDTEEEGVWGFEGATREGLNLEDGAIH